VSDEEASCEKCFVVLLIEVELCKMTYGTHVWGLSLSLSAREDRETCLVIAKMT
jgi:hypothetical protein